MNAIGRKRRSDSRDLDSKSFAESEDLKVFDGISFICFRFGLGEGKVSS